MASSFTRRGVAVAAASAAACSAQATQRRERAVICAPSNLGLRPNPDGAEPGAWRAPEALLSAGVQTLLGAGVPIRIARPRYEFDAQPGTRIRNGQTMRVFSLELAAAVRGAIETGRFPLVLGGDCSVLLGCLYGARLAGGRGLVHIDGHSDFFHPGNYDANARLGSAAGMDLALATGRGEALLTQWSEVVGPLAADADTVQVGERDALSEVFDQYYGDIAQTRITRLIIQDVLANGVETAASIVLARLSERGLHRVWLHVDLDVLDQAVMPAVDSPGAPGLDFAQLASLLGLLLDSQRFVGIDAAIYDPERDPERRYAAPITRALAQAIAHAP